MTTKEIIFKDPTNRTKWILRLAYICIALMVISVVSTFFEQRLFEDIKNLNFATEEQMIEAAENSDARSLILAAIFIPIILAFIIVFYCWLYRMKNNSIALGATDRKYSAGWSVGMHFIPIANIFLSLLSIKELWQTSKSPNKWQKEKIPSFIYVWWALFWLTTLVDRYIFRRFLKTEDINELIFLNNLSMGSDLIFIVVLILQIKLIKQVYINVMGNKG